ncbi:MAG TPA: hypothetical protein VJS43_06435 [Candidatus Acidoferrales bacterium]|nr:hypothetical protein [Candidatus Acidoferrales bacterium]
MPRTKRRPIRERSRTNRKTRRRPSSKRVDDARRDRLARAAHAHFLKSGAMILDVFGKLDD